jgi:hypothetical protein
MLKRASLFSVLWLVGFYVFNAAQLTHEFPTGYTWTDLLLNYQGGVIRRSLLGQLAFTLYSVFPPQYLLIGVIGSAYAVMLGVLLLFPTVSGVMRLYCVFSPFLLSFVTYNPIAFGRKDIIHLALYAAFALYALRATSNDRHGNNSLYPAICLAFLLATTFLVIDTVLFFLPFYVLTGYLALRRINAKNKTVLCVIAIAPTLLLALALFSLPAPKDVGTVIHESWSGLLPHKDFVFRGAFKHISFPLSVSLTIGYNEMTSFPKALGWLFLFVFSTSMLAWIFLDTLPALRRLAQDRIVLILLPPCLLFPLALFFLACDYGRWINQINLYWFFFLAFVSAPPETLDKASVPNSGGQARWLAVGRRLRHSKSFLGIVAALWLTVGMKYFIFENKTPVLVPAVYLYELFFGK